MYELILDQATELFLLGKEINEMRENLDTLYRIGFSLSSKHFVSEYKKLSEMSTRFMLLEISYKSLLEQIDLGTKKPAFELLAGPEMVS